MKIKYCLTIPFVICLFHVQNLNAQKSFQPGYIITNDNIEVKGFIDFKGFKQDPTCIKYRATDSSKVMILTPKLIKAFKNEEDYYVSATVKIDISPTSAQELLKNQSIDDGAQRRTFNEASQVSVEKIVPAGEIRYRSRDSVVVVRPNNIEASVFLKTLATGTMNLFYFKDTAKKEHYYVSNVPGQYEELNRVFYVDNTKSIRLLVYEVEFYKPQLIKYMAGQPSFEDKIFKMSFTQNSITGLIKDFNAASGSTGK